MAGSKSYSASTKYVQTSKKKYPLFFTDSSISDSLKQQ